MQLRFDPLLPADAALLGRFLAGSEWPYHQPCGCQREAQHPKGWRSLDVEPADADGYALRREEAEAL